jgi:hypothetical protein
VLAGVTQAIAAGSKPEQCWATAVRPRCKAGEVALQWGDVLADVGEP